MLKHGCLHAFSAPEALHYASVFVSYVPLDHVLDRFDFVKTVVEPDDLTDELGTFGHQAVVDGLVDRLKAIAEGLLHVADAMKLRIVRAHHRAVIAEKLFTTVAKVAQGLVVQHARLGLGHMRIQNRLGTEGTLRGHTKGVSNSTCVC